MALVDARQHNQVRIYRLALTCAGYGGITASECQQRGCCYVPVAPYIGSAVLELPVCVYPNAGASTYAMSGNMAATGAPERLSGKAVLRERGCLLGAFARQALAWTRRAASVLLGTTCFAANDERTGLQRLGIKFGPGWKVLNARLRACADPVHERTSQQLHADFLIEAC